MNFKATQDAFLVLERLAAVCATPGVDDDTKKIANERMQELLSSVIKTSVIEINTSGLGIVTMND
jgi:hypothetical protein